MERNCRIRPAGRLRAGFRKFSKKNSCIARARRGIPGLKGPRPDLTMTGRCRSYSSARSSKIKIRTSSCNKANLASLQDEVRILIFDDPAELYERKRPQLHSAQLDSIITHQTSICACMHGRPGWRGPHALRGLEAYIHSARLSQGPGPSNNRIRGDRGAKCWAYGDPGGAQGGQARTPWRPAGSPGPLN